MSHAARLHLLGGLRLARADAPAAAGAAMQRKRLALLAVVARAGPRGVSRERLLALLWPDQAPEEARHALDVALSALRRALPEGALVAVPLGVALDPARVGVDATAFEAALAADDPAGAVALYGGPFLDGVTLPGAAEFARWAEAERAVLGRRHADALAALTAAARAAGDHTQAARWAEGWAAADPLAARPAAALVAALLAVGDRSGAVRVARRHEALVRAELDVEPDPCVAAALAAAGATPPDGMPARPAPSLTAPPIETPAVATPAEAPAEAPLAAFAAAAPAGGGAHAGVPAAGSGSAAASPGPATRWRAGPAGRAWQLRPVTAGLAALVAFVALGAWAAAHGDEPALAEERVVVAPFVNLTGDPEFDALGRMAAEWVTQGLSEARLGEPVPTETAVASARHADSAVARAGGDRMQLLARETRAALVVTGAIYRTGDSVALHAQITDARHGRVVRALDPVVAPAAAPAPAVAELRGRMLGALAPLFDVWLDQRLDGRIARSAVDGAPPSYAAYREVAEALRAGYGNRGGAAMLAHLQRAHALDTAYVRPVLLMANTYANMGRWDAADSLLRQLQRAPDRLTPFEAATADVLRTWVASDLRAAYAAARRAAALEPGGAMTMQVALEAIRLNRPGEALTVLRTLDPDRGVVRDAPFYWTYLADAHHALARHDDELAAVRAARARFPQHDGYLLLFEARALAALGRPAEALVQVDARLALPPGRGFGLPTQLLHTSAELARHGHPDAARATAARLLAWMDARGPGAFDARRWELFRARTLLALGRDREAAARLAALVAADSTVDDPLFYLGVAAARLGDRTTAARMSARLAALPGRDSMYFDYARAAIAAQLGDRAAALALLRQAFVRGLAVANGRLHADPPFDPLRGDPAFEALVRPKP